MGQIPGWLLRHTVMVEPYLGWNTYGAATQVRCFVDEKISSRYTQAGVQVRAHAVAYARLATSCPVGSRITLADGRRGYASAVARRDGGGLPTPDHLEVAIELGLVVGPPQGETVTLLRRTVVGSDRHGSDRYSTTSIPVAGCAVRALSSQETAGGGRDTVTDSIEVIMPPGTVVTPVDRMQVRGLVYNVDGTPDTQKDSVTGVEPGLRVIGRRTTG